MIGNRPVRTTALAESLESPAGGTAVIVAQIAGTSKAPPSLSDVWTEGLPRSALPHKHARPMHHPPAHARPTSHPPRQLPPPSPTFQCSWTPALTPPLHLLTSIGAARGVSRVTGGVDRVTGGVTIDVFAMSQLAARKMIKQTDGADEDREMSCPPPSALKLPGAPLAICTFPSLRIYFLRFRMLLILFSQLPITSNQRSWSASWWSSADWIAAQHQLWHIKHSRCAYTTFLDARLRHRSE